jgi:predicted CXXCH cytochrome family protein
MGCHDPHPSNPNYKYLRVDTAKGSKIDAFCAVCHPVKAEGGAAQAAIFNSMDETAAKGAVAAKPAAPKAPAATDDGAKKKK